MKIQEQIPVVVEWRRRAIRGREPDAFSALTAHFFRGFFQNDIISTEGDLRPLLVTIAAILGTPAMLISFFLWAHSAHGNPLPERLFFSAFSMAVMGLVTALEWDTLLLDRRDHAILGALPLSPRTILAAKAAALALLLLFFFVGINVFTVVLFPGSVSNHPESLARAVVMMAAEGVNLLAGNILVFLLVLALRCLLVSLLPGRLRGIASAVQWLLMLGFLTALLFSPQLLSPRAAELVAARGSGGAAPWAWFPPGWFLGLQERLLGEGGAAARTAALHGLLALGCTALVATAAWLLAFHRSWRRAGESIVSERVAGSGWFSRLLPGLAENPVTQAVLGFTLLTLIRSRRHATGLAGYLAFGAALVLEGLWSLKLTHGAVPPATWLSIPLILMFFLLSGLRVVFAVPAEFPAHWIFRITEAPDERVARLNGVRRCMLLVGIAPVALASAGFMEAKRGLLAGGLHLVFLLLCGLLLRELLLFSFRKIPFTCSYLPGKSHLRSRWVFYWVGFSLYAYGLASLESRGLGHFLFLVTVEALGLLLLLGLNRLRAHQFRKPWQFVHEDEFDAFVQPLHLSEKW